MTNTDRGVLTGGALGATTGALIGSTTKHTGAGAVIGGTLGALTGGLIGNSIDESERRAAAMATVRGPLTLQEIAQMSHNQFSDGVIISKIRASGTAYNLSVEDIRYLKANAVSDAVIMEMNATASRAPRRVYRETVVQPVYVVEPPPPPPPPVHLGIGFGYTRVR
jgi:uncharacterized protein YcfJ